MSKLYRYTFTKKLFPESILLFFEKGKYRSFLDDFKILEFIHFKTLRDLEKRKINYVVLSGLAIIDSKTFIDNTYKIYYLKVKLIAFLEDIKFKMLKKIE